MSKSTKIGDVVVANPKISISKDCVLPYVPMEEIIPNGRYVYSSQERTYKGGTRFKNNDVLFARITPCLQNRKIGQYISTSKTNMPAYGSTEYFIFRAIEGVTDPAFMFYLLKSDLVVKTAINSMKGASGRQRAEIQPILDLVITIPSYRAQRIIGEFLSTYDNLIENNNHRIAILEAMAQKLYREWFVHFRFSGHENVKMVESEIGMIPEGWQVGTIETNTILLRRGITPKYDETASKTVINQKCIRDYSVDMGVARQQSKEYPDELTLQYGDILVNSTGAGTLGRVGQFFSNAVNTTVDSHVTIVRPKKDCTCYIGAILKSLQSELMDMGVGSTNQTELNRDLIKGISVVYPSDKVLNLFECSVNNWMSLKQKLVSQNINLRKTRDLLLPRLIYGDIDVSKLNIPIREEQLHAELS